MSQICWYFQIHQPWRLRPYRVFDISTHHDYFVIPGDLEFANDRVLQKVASKSYRPMLTLLETMLVRVPEFRFALSLSGVVLQQLREYTPDVVAQLQRMVNTGRVELLSETMYHSLASLFSPTEFTAQVQAHQALLDELFGVRPRVFRNTELIYSNDIAKMVDDMGFIGMLAEGADQVLHGRPPTRVYAPPHNEAFALLLKHYRLSDDIAFRFSQQSWSGWPLHSETYAHWLTAPFATDALINLFMDFETFGEHQWESTGIFAFFEHLIPYLDAIPETSFVTPSQVVMHHKPQDVFSSEWAVSWADVDRDVTAWLGNPMQHDVVRALYDLESRVRSSGDDELIEDWRRLQTSDHFYYMCTKWAADGDVHAYFSPYGSPYDAYANYNNVLADMRWRLGV